MTLGSIPKPYERKKKTMKKEEKRKRKKSKLSTFTCK
jgi:hypothetical protein